MDNINVFRTPGPDTTLQELVDSSLFRRAVKGGTLPMPSLHVWQENLHANEDLAQLGIVPGIDAMFLGSPDPARIVVEVESWGELVFERRCLVLIHELVHAKLSSEPVLNFFHEHDLVVYHEAYKETGHRVRFLELVSDLWFCVEESEVACYTLRLLPEQTTADIQQRLQCSVRWRERYSRNDYDEGGFLMEYLDLLDVTVNSCWFAGLERGAHNKSDSIIEQCRVEANQLRILRDEKLRQVICDLELKDILRYLDQAGDLVSTCEAMENLMRSLVGLKIVLKE